VSLRCGPFAIRERWISDEHASMRIGRCSKRKVHRVTIAANLALLVYGVHRGPDRQAWSLISFHQQLSRFCCKNGLLRFQDDFIYTFYDVRRGLMSISPRRLTSEWPWPFDVVQQPTQGPYTVFNFCRRIALPHSHEHRYCLVDDMGEKERAFAS
jgi:hypothetical protein